MTSEKPKTPGNSHQKQFHTYQSVFYTVYHKIRRIQKKFEKKVCQSVMLSPGEITKQISEEYDRKREKARERESTIQFKKRRREKKEQQSNHQKTCEVREVKSYKTAVDMNNNICSDDICEIPPPQTVQTCKELIPGVEDAALCVI